MDYKKLEFANVLDLWELQKRYKAEIGEDEPEDACRVALAAAIECKKILFFGAFDGEKLVGCCSVSVVFSTFNYLPGGVFEDFYILPRLSAQGDRPLSCELRLPRERRLVDDRRLRRLRPADVPRPRLYDPPRQSPRL